MNRPRFSLPLTTLSPRQKQIAILIANGCENKDIMAKLGIALSTVNGTKLHIYRKLGITGSMGSGSQHVKLTKHAIKEGWIEL